jgi:hypothetical protein
MASSNGPMAHMNGPQAHRRVEMAKAEKIPKAFQGSASARNDYLAGESAHPSKKGKAPAKKK